MEKIIDENLYEHDNEREQLKDFLYVYDVKSDFEKSNLKKINVLLHWHKEFEINFPGSSGTFMLDDERMCFEKKDFLIVNSEQLHSIQTNNFTPFYSILINLDEISNYHSLTTGLIKNITSRKLPTVISQDSPIYSSVYHLSNAIIDGKKNNTVSQETLALLSIALLNVLYDNGIQKDDEDFVNNRIKKTITYISDNLTKKITIKDLCKISLMSESYFIRTFKKIVLMSPITYINELRLEKAYELLKNGHSVTNTSIECGFNNQGYFIRQFKKKYNMIPSMVKNGKN